MLSTPRAIQQTHSQFYGKPLKAVSQCFVCLNIWWVEAGLQGTDKLPGACVILSKALVAASGLLFVCLAFVQC